MIAPRLLLRLVALLAFAVLAAVACTTPPVTGDLNDAIDDVIGEPTPVAVPTAPPIPVTPEPVPTLVVTPVDPDCIDQDPDTDLLIIPGCEDGDFQEPEIN